MSLDSSPRRGFIPLPSVLLALVSGVIILAFALTTGADAMTSGTTASAVYTFFAVIAFALGILTFIPFLFLILPFRLYKWVFIFLALPLEAVKILFLVLMTGPLIFVGKTGIELLFLIQILISFGVLGSTFAGIIFRKQFERFSRNRIGDIIISIAPSVILIVLFMSAYFVEVFQLTGARDRAILPFAPGIDWTNAEFNTPTWDASYYLENWLDQFTSGLKFPTEIVFNLTSPESGPHQLDWQTPCYWRTRTWDKYAYQDATYTSIWLNSTSRTRDMPTNSEDVSNLGSYWYTVRMPIEHTATHEFFLPTAWSGPYMGFVDTTTVRVLDNNGDERNDVTIQIKEIYLPGAGAGFEDQAGTRCILQFDGLEGKEKSIIEYDIAWYDPRQYLTSAASMSLGPNIQDFETQYSHAFGTDWSNIKAMYLQIPEGEDLPDGVSDYETWAPTAADYAETWKDSGTFNVFQQAYIDAMRLAPNSTAVPNAGLSFDIDMWTGQYTGTMAHPSNGNPDPPKDYVEWFLGEHKKGTAAHFSSALAMILRLQDIPCRTVTGYVGGVKANSTYVPSPSAQSIYPPPANNPDRMAVTQWFTHSWVEVLIPDIANGGGIWFPMDPMSPVAWVGTLITIRQVFVNPADGIPNGMGHIGMIENASNSLPGGDSDFILRHGDTAIISGLLVDLVTVSPIVNANVSFSLIYNYPEENKSISGADSGFQTLTGQPTNVVQTDETGLATIIFKYDVTQHGFITGYFFATYTPPGSDQSITAATTSQIVLNHFAQPHPDTKLKAENTIDQTTNGDKTEDDDNDSSSQLESLFSRLSSFTTTDKTIVAQIRSVGRLSSKFEMF